MPRNFRRDLTEVPAAGLWWLVGGYVVLVVLSPIAGWVRRRQLDRAIAANGHAQNG